jgi:pimeloyl-ACP methyl ester carboxylesterase
MSVAERVREGGQTTVRVGEDELIVIRGGQGNPVLVLHDELGYPGWLNWNADLAAERELIIPLLPGFGRAPRIDWVFSWRDLIQVLARWLREQKLAPIDVIGFSFGGWLAAEMALADPKLFRRMVLVGPFGIKAPEGKGEIADIFAVPALKWLASTVKDYQNLPEFAQLYGGGHETPEQFEAFDDARAECARLAWQPYMFNPSLPHHLGGLKGVPTTIVWGDQDEIVPRAAMDIYAQGIPGAHLNVVSGSGHRPEVEKADEFLGIVRKHFEKN